MNVLIKIIIVFLLGVVSLNAQNQVSGIVSENNQVLEFANVILYNDSSSEVVTGVISNQNGRYIFNDIANGNYYIAVSMLGFETKKSEVFELSTNKELDFNLIEENPKNAQKFTTSLSKVYRYVLEQKSKELVTVDEELNFARTYMSLLKMRFEDSIIFEIPDKASNPESKVVPLSLQLLLENAVKHNMVTSSKPLHIRIYEDGNYLVVMNNLQIKQIVKKSSGVGLENIKQRYALLSNKKVHINQREKDFAVAIPMLTKQVSIMRTTQKSTASLNEDYVRARKRVEELKAFYYSLISYCFVIPFLIFIWYKFSNNTIQWFWFPMFGWGLSLAFQAYRVFVNNGPLGGNWEKRKIEEYMQKEEANKRYN